MGCATANKKLFLKPPAYSDFQSLLDVIQLLSGLTFKVVFQLINTKLVCAVSYQMTQ